MALHIFTAKNPHILLDMGLLKSKKATVTDAQCQHLPRRPTLELSDLPMTWADASCDDAQVEDLWKGEIDRLKKARKAVTAVCVNLLEFYIATDCYQSFSYSPVAQ